MSKSTTMLKPRSARSPQPWSPHAYQKKAVKFLLEHAAAALFLDPGLGKTSVSLAAFSFLLKRKVASKALVIAPIRACYSVWPVEVAEWKDFAHLRCVVLHGKNKDKLLEENADVYIINPEGLEWLIFGKGGSFDSRRWKRLGFDTLIIDELTKFKHSKGVRYKALKTVLGSFSRRWGLTGSPAANGLLDLFGQCFVLDEGNALGRYITHYKFRYFTNPDNQGWKWLPKPGAKEEIYERLKPLALRMSDTDYLDVPEVVDLYDKLELPPKARIIYDALEDDLLAKIESKVVVAANAAAVGTKLWQVCNGGLYVDDDVLSIIGGRGQREALKIHDVKTDWLEELIDELQGTPLLVAYQFQHDLERLHERFGKDAPAFGKDAAKNKELERAWNANELPFVFGQQESIAHALNLQKGSAAHLAHYSLTWNFEVYDQLVRRIKRQGTKAGRIFRHHAVIQDSTDEDRRHALRAKNKGQQALFDALVARRRGK